MSEDIKAREVRARELLISIDMSREFAVTAGMSPGDAAKIGAVAEAVAQDSLASADEMRARADAGASAGGEALLQNIFGMLHAFFAGNGSGTTPTPQQIAAMDRAVRVVVPAGEPTLAAQEVRAVLEQNDRDAAKAAPIVAAEPKSRAPEVQVDLGTWAPDEASLRALQWREAWIMEQLPAFHEANRGKTGTRPRVSLSYWLLKRPGQADHVRPASS